MKKTFLLVAAFCASMAMKGYAQENLALNKTAYASTSANDDYAPSKSVDGDTGTRWAANSDEEGKHQTGGVVEEGYDGYWYYVDLGEETDFNVLQIVWEGGYGKAFKVYTATSETDGKPDWNSEPVYVQTSKALNADELKLQTYKLGDQKARFVKLQATELGIAPWFSFWEFRVMKMDLSPVLTTLNVSKERVKVGDTFTISILDQFNEALNDAEVTVSNAEKQPDGSYKALAAGDVVVTVAYNGKTLTKTVKAYDSVLTTATVSPVFFLVGQDQAMTVVGRDSEGNVVDGLTWTVEGAERGVNNLVRADEEGTVTFTLSDGNGHTATATACAVASTAGEPAFNEENDAWVYHNDITGIGVANPAWNWGYEFYSQTNIDSNTMLMVQKAGTFGLSNNSIEQSNGYKLLHFDVFPTKDVEGAYLNWENAGLAAEEGQTEANIRKMPKLEAGKWNHVSLDITGATNLKGYMQLYFAQGDARPDILLDNVYVSKNVDLGEAVLTTVTAPEFVKVGEEFQLTMLDQYKKDVDASSVTITATNAKVVEGKPTTFVAEADGEVVLTVTQGETSKTVSLTAVSTAPDTKLSDEDYCYFDNSDSGFEYYGTAWEGGYTAKAMITIGDDKILAADNVLTYGFRKAVDGDGYKSINFAIRPSRDVQGALLRTEGWGLNEMKMPDLKGGEWNTVSLDISKATAYSGYLKFALVDYTKNNTSDVNILLDNIYLSKEKANIVEDVTINETVDDRGLHALSGYAKSEETINNLMTDESYTAYDLTALSVESDGYKLEAANPNAIIVVDGTENNGVGVPSVNWSNESGNLVVKRNDGFYFPVKQIELTDGHQAYTTFFVSAGDTGYKYTRNVAAGKWISITSPVNINTLPEGITVYEADEAQSDGNNLAFKKVDVIQANTPYIAYAESAVTLEGTGTGDLDMRSEKLLNATVGTATLHSNYGLVAGSEGNYYGLYSAATNRDENKLTLQRLGDTAQLGSFRAYLELPTGAQPSQYRVLLNDGTVTAIYNLQTVEEANADNNVYSIDGRLVKRGSTSVAGLEKGVYVINGKKVIVK